MTRRWGATALLVAAALLASSSGAVGAAPASGESGAGETAELVVATVRAFSESSLSRAAGVDVSVVKRIEEIDRTIIEVPAAEADLVAARLSARRDIAEAHGSSTVTAFGTNDPLWSRQPWMAAHGFETAWAHTTGSSAILVAVLDTGVNDTADLAGRVLDGVDLVNGGIGRGHDDDPDTHGTIAATVIGAAGNNGFGAAGACWQCRILPIKVLDGDGNGSSFDVADGIVHAANAGASVINLSLGGPGADPAVAAAVSYAESRGAIVVAAAGNDYAERGMVANYPAAFPNVVGVGSYVNDSVGVASYSQRGAQWYELAAGACALDGGFGDVCGTSFSAPYVAGTVALMRSLRPDVPAAQHKSLLFDAAMRWPTSVAANFRHGRLAAGAALQLASTAIPPDTTPPTLSLGAPAGAFNRDATIELSINAADNVALRSLWLMWGTATVHGWYSPSVAGVHRLPADLLSAVAGDGTHTLRLVGTDTSGNVAEATATVTIDTQGPVAAVFRPGTNTTVRRHLDIVAYSADPSGVVATFIIVNQRVVSGWLGDGVHTARVPIAKNGRQHIVTLTIDRANNISASNHVFVNGRRR